MKRVTWKVLGVGLVVIMSGCASERFSLLDIDLRTPEQTKAYITEAEVVYKTPVNQAVVGATVGTAVVPNIVWQYVTDLLKITRGRIRVLSFEGKK